MTRRSTPTHGTLSESRAALRRAAERVLADCRGGAREVPEPTVLCEEIGGVVAVVEALLAAEPAPELPPRRADRSAIVDLLRARVLEEGQGGDEASLLRLVRVLEAARASVSDVGDTLLSPGVLTPYGHRLLREVAHTLRSPMGSMVMLAGTLAEGGGGEVNELQRKHLGIIHRAALSLANMASDLLNLTGEDAGTTAEPEAFHVHEIVGTVADAIAPVAEERGLRFTVHAPEERARLGRPVPLEKALMNLALNAALLARDGVLELCARPEESDVVRFSVSVGPTEEDVESLFTVFPSPGREADYTLSRSGLGLSTARDLVRRMGSDLVTERTSDGIRLSFGLVLPES